MAAVETDQALLNIELVCSPGPGEVQQLQLQLPAGSTLADALAASGWPAEGLRVGIWCKAKELDTPLRDCDRVELYRPLKVDPKEARRQRYKRDKPAKPGPSAAV